MAFLVLLGIFLLVFVLPRFLRGGGDARTRLLRGGLQARGLIVSAASTGTSTSYNGQRYQVRNVVLDVEVPGRAPYEVSLAPMFPRLCEPFPGSVLDLRVDRRDPNNVAVVGPAGSSLWIDATVGLFPWSTSALAAARSGCATAVTLAIALFLAAGAVISFLVPGEAPPHEPPEEPAVTPHTTPTHPHPTATTPAVVHPTCDAAMRCCKTLGRGGCASFESKSETECKAALHEETIAARRAHKACE
jgi:hypothetical protein